MLWFPGLLGWVECVWGGLGMRLLSLCCAANCVASLFVLSTESTDNFVSSKCLPPLGLLWEFLIFFPSCCSASYVLLEEKLVSQKQVEAEVTQSSGFSIHEQDYWGVHLGCLRSPVCFP